MTRKLSKKKQHMKLVENDIHAVEDYHDNKTLTIQDLKAIKPLNSPQKQMFESYFSDNYILANGSAGTGKTFAAIYLGLTDLLSKKSKQNQLLIVRSAVPSREIGHLPGDHEEKLEPYETPYKDIFQSLLGRVTAYDKMKKQNKVRFVPTSFVRGLTWDNCVVILDEIQNMTFYEINSVITRMGSNSKLIIIGDQPQSDLHKNRNDKSGMQDFLKVVKCMDGTIDEIVFTKHDIVRSAFVKSWIWALEDSGVTL